MRRIVIALVLLGALAAPGGAAAATKTVVIKAGGFDPATVTIQTGDKVTWKNTDKVQHQVVSDGGFFASPVLAAGKSYSFTFQQAKTYHYHDGLHPARKGKVIVKAKPTPPAVALTTTAAIVTFGEVAPLSGTVSTGKANETVTIFGRQIDQPSFVQVATVLTGPGGTFTYNAAPQIQTAYQARFKTSVSAELSVLVRPKLRFLGSARYLSVRVLAARSFAGHFVVLQRRTGAGWISVRVYRLGKRSGRVFAVPRHAGLYRVALNSRQAGPGYLASLSGTQRVVRHRHK
jgi:plastocyanin